jgi:cytochrome c oxidase subunit IV
MDHHEETHPSIGYGTYVLIWLGLLILTGLTVTMAGIHFGGINVFLVLIVAGVKSILVLYYFMHLKYEKPLFRTMVLVAVISLVTFIVLLFSDILFRY